MIYAGFEADCCDEARKLIEEFGREIVWNMGMLICGYPITWHIEEMDSRRLPDFLKRNFGVIKKWLEL